MQTNINTLVGYNNPSLMGPLFLRWENEAAIVESLGEEAGKARSTLIFPSTSAVFCARALCQVLMFSGANPPSPCRIGNSRRFRCRPSEDLATRPKRPPKTALKLVRMRSCYDVQCPFLALHRGESPRQFQPKPASDLAGRA